jgi:23S rRNA pseudouridine2604 synthase
MLLSDDGRIVDKLLNPSFKHEREYTVRVDKRITDSALNRMRKGVRIEGYMTKEALVDRIDERAFRITLTEGKKHQIRRMCAALGYQAKDLKRVRIMHLKLGNLSESKHRPLTKVEHTKLLGTLDVKESSKKLVGL